MAKQAIFVLGFAVVFGILVPWYRGFDFLDPVMLTAYSCLALLFVAPASAEAFALDRSAPAISGTITRSALILAYGWGIAVLVMAAGIVTVNLSHWHGYILAPPASLLISILLLSLTASLAVIGACALLARAFSASAVKGFVRLAFLVVLSLAAFGYRLLPPHARTTLAEHMTTDAITHLALISSSVLASIGVILIALAARRDRLKAAETGR